MEEEMWFFVVPENGIPVEFPLYLLEANFGFNDSKEEIVKELNKLIQEIEKFRDNL